MIMANIQEGIIIGTVDGTQRVICLKSDLIQQQPPPEPRLTPTGKISHAKTRVYIQRYRKEWEQMDEFKGWLTASPGETTRAECRYCKKNLHAHRLSLLKHTCTLKHQRAAELYKKEMYAKKLKLNADCKEGLADDTAFEEFDLSTLKTSMSDHNEDDNENYVDNETLEMDENYDNTENSTIIYEDNSDSCVLRVEEEQEIDDTNGNVDGNDNENQIDVSIAKIKRELQTDALAQAMAHVHGEYSDNNEEQQDNDEIDDVDEIAAQEVHDNSAEEIVVPDQNITSTEMEVIEAEENDKKILDNEKSMIKIIVNKETKSPVKIKNDDTKNLKGSSSVHYAINADEFAQLEKSGVTSGRQLVALGNGQVLRLSNRQATTGGQFVLKKVTGDISSLLTTKQLRPIAPKTVSSISTKSSSKKVILQGNLGNKSNLQKKTSMPLITTLVTDTTHGTPLAGLIVQLHKQSGGEWDFQNESITMANGRCNDLSEKCPAGLGPGRYKLRYETEKYYSSKKLKTHYPFIEIFFDIVDMNATYHTPLLLSPFGYSTYKSNHS